MATLSSHETRPLALVTGAAGIIGPGIIAELRQQGWRAVATDRDLDSFALYHKALGRPVEADAILPADLSRQEVCEHLVRQVEADHGPLSAIVNGAAYNPALDLTELTEPDVQRSLAVNFAAPLYLTQAALPSLIQNAGSVIHLSSVLVTEPRKGSLLYACAKAGLEKAAEIMALELLDSGVRVNTIRIGRVPGFAFLRETLKKLPDHLARKIVQDLMPRRMEDMRRTCGERAIGTPRDIAQTVAFLLSPAARFINGQTLVLDGGYHPDTRLNAVPGKPYAEHIAEWLRQNAVPFATEANGVASLLPEMAR